MNRLLLALIVLLCAALPRVTAQPAITEGDPVAIPIAGPESLVRVCPAPTQDHVPPDGRDGKCQIMPLHQVDPQQRQLWISQTVQVTEADQSRLVGLLISAKASSTAYLNGVLIGSNGRPGDSKAKEISGLMDTVFQLPAGLLRAGSNRIDLRMSSHRGWLHLQRPVHAVRLVPYLIEQDRVLRRYLPTLLPLGVFVLACFYFLSMAVRSEHPAHVALLGTLALLAALQLLIETSRGVIAYRYPMHDVRLIVALACNVAIGLNLVAILCRQFVPRSLQLPLTLVSAAAMCAVAALLPGMDSKSNLVLLIASAVGIACAAMGVRSGIAQSHAHLVALAVFGALNLMTPSMFLDVYLFYLIAGMLVFLMVQQAKSHAEEIAVQREQTARADRLQAILDEREHAETETVLSVQSVGRLRRVAASELAWVSGAGDYAELHLADGESVLHTVGLTELEALLPAYFLRVHRSHIVNTRMVERLQQAEGGTGTLFLRNGASVPVSRRIMPGVRKVLR